MIYIGVQNLDSYSRFYNQMIDQAFQNNIAEEFPTRPYTQIMNQEFLSAYREALKYSNLELDKELKFRNVTIYQDEHMHQLYTTGPSQLPHLVLLHGFGGTSLTFVRTFQHLKNYFQVHALDTFGVGLSSRKRWRQDFSVQETITYFIDAIEQWRKTLGIQKFIMAGHSFGGYISTCYYEKYSERVIQLVLLSPAGSGKITQEAITAKRAELSKIFWFVASTLFKWGLRPCRVIKTFFVGNKVMNSFLQKKLKLQEEEKQAWKKYLYQISLIDATSQGGFYTLFKWPMNPVKSIQQILRSKPPKFKVDFFFGDKDWMNRDGATSLAKDFQNMRIHFVPNAGHHMAFDNPEHVTNNICKVVQK